MKLRLSVAATRDIRELRSYIAHDNPAAAIAVSLRLKKAILMLAERPNIGRPTAQAKIREWAVPGLPFIVPYRITDNAVEILRVWHTSRQRPDEWQ